MKEMDNQKRTVSIDVELFHILGVAPGEGVKYLESKKAIDMSPVHIKAHRILKQQPVASS